MLFMTDDFEVFDKSTYDGLNKYSDMKNYLIIRKQNGSIYIKSLDEYHDNGVHVKISGKGNIIIFEEPIFFRNSLISISSNYNLIHYSWTRRMVINYIYIYQMVIINCLILELGFLLEKLYFHVMKSFHLY